MSRVPVAVLGATGLVGQKLVQLLENHPFFYPERLVASPNSEGREYGEWCPKSPFATKRIQGCTSLDDCHFIFSCLSATVAHAIESDLLNRGHTIISNARSHRYHSDVPIVIPEVNLDHLDLLSVQQTPGKIATMSNCSTSGVTLTVKPLLDQFGVEQVDVTMLQAISGAGSTDLEQIAGNILPYIEGEEEKIERESQKILGHFAVNHIEPAQLSVRATCFRVPVAHGHTAALTINLSSDATAREVVDLWNQWPGLDLPTAPKNPLVYATDPFAPQPLHHSDCEGGMGVTVGRLRMVTPRKVQCIALAHNLVRGAAGGALLIGEALFARSRGSIENQQRENQGYRETKRS